MELVGRRWREVRQGFTGYLDDRVPRMAAALSSYAIFSLAPLLVIAIGTAGPLFGADAARDLITAQSRSLVGEEGGSAVTTMIEHGHASGNSLIATIIGSITLFIGATACAASSRTASTPSGRCRRRRVRHVALRLLAAAVLRHGVRYRLPPARLASRFSPSKCDRDPALSSRLQDSFLLDEILCQHSLAFFLLMSFMLQVIVVPRAWMC